MSGVLPERHKIITGAATAGTTAATTLIAAPDLGRLCITSLQIGRTDTSTAALSVTLNDLAKTALVVDNPGTGKSIPFIFDAPLMWPPQTALTFQASAAVTTLFLSAQGFALE